MPGIAGERFRLDVLTLRAPAKINWFLNVTGKRVDGYHDIVSLMQCVSLWDSLRFEPSDDMEVVTAAPIPREGNLVYRAMRLLRETAGVKKGARITLEKEIPMAAGLGGGSSDAACALTGLNKLWELGLSARDLAGLGGTLGSDVPFFFCGPASVVRGRGEIVSPVAIERSRVVVMVKPQVGVSTTWAYGELDRETLRTQVSTKNDDKIKSFCQSLESGDFRSLSNMRRNDFEAPVIREYPVVGHIERELRRLGALFSSMSGSGPTVFGVFDSEDRALFAAGALQTHWCRVVKTLTSAE